MTGKYGTQIAELRAAARSGRALFAGRVKRRDLLLPRFGIHPDRVPALLPPLDLLQGIERPFVIVESGFLMSRDDDNLAALVGHRWGKTYRVEDLDIWAMHAIASQVEPFIRKRKS